jgi:uncharacterized membrane-anchored protein YitT (DUF2179 family)/predicted metal-dependent HD superfamily phosphohydrolase
MDMTMNNDFEKLVAGVLSRLERELPAHLFYHNAAHTEKVLEAAGQIGKAEGIGDEDMRVLQVAAAYHDIGFLKTYQEHEAASCVMAREELPAAGYSATEIDAVCKLIMATKMPQRPHGLLESIICDADLHYLGTDAYEHASGRLYEEWKAEGLADIGSWPVRQVAFLQAHRFFTASARNQYEAKKQEHLGRVKRDQFRKQHRSSALQDLYLVVLGVLTAGFGLKGFLVPNHFFDGGVTGISLLAHELYHVNLAYIIVAFNLPLIIAGYFSISKSFALKTLAAVVLLGVCLLFMPYPAITSDKLLISIFGGVFLGLGIGLTMKAGCALDGVEVLALYTLKRTSFTITEIILGINMIIFAIAAFKFGMETALYSVLTYFVASRMIDYVIEGLQAFTGVTIISGESELIKHRLVNELGRGITVYKGERGFLPGAFEVSSDCDIIFTVATRMELRKLKKLIYETDGKAFVFVSTIREASGGILSRRHAH